MSIQEDPANNQLHIFIPKCRICKQKMIRWDIKGIVKQDDVSRFALDAAGATANFEAVVQNSSIAPSVTHLNLVYKCRTHDSSFFRAPPDMIEKMNNYPPGNIVYHHVEF